MGKLIIKVGNIVDDTLLKNADAIVCPTNPMMKFGSGVCGAIFKKAGIKDLEEYTEKEYGLSYRVGGDLNKMKPTEIRVTPGFQIPCDIIFAQGIRIWSCQNREEAIHFFVHTYENLLNCITQRNYRSVLIPALGTGKYGFTHEDTAGIVKDLLEKYAQENDVTLTFVVTGDDIAKLYMP